MILQMILWAVKLSPKLSQDMPVEKPLLFLIQRGKLDLEINISLESVDEEEMQELARKNKKKAEDLYKKAVEAKRDGQWRKAISQMKQAMQLAPDEAAYASELAWLYYRIGEDKNSILTMERAVKLAPNYKTHLNMGRMYIDLKQYDKGFGMH